MKNLLDTGFDVLELDIGIGGKEDQGNVPIITSDYMENLKDVNMEISDLTNSAKKRATWRTAKSYKLPLCDLKKHVMIYHRKFGYFTSSFKRTSTGIPIADIKCQTNVRLFALSAIDIANGIARLKQKNGWCIITTPRRRHKENHFATAVCQMMADYLHIPFYQDVVEAPNRGRIKPQFNIVREVKEPNMILYDDILTTGSTIEATIRAFPDKNIITIIGINNN